MAYDKTVDTSTKQEFDAMLVSNYQGSSLLKGTVTVKPKIRGESRTLDSMAPRIFQRHIPGTEIATSQSLLERVKLNITEWTDGVYSNIFSIQKAPWDDKNELAENCAQAAGRREDQIILDALSASTPETTQDFRAGKLDFQAMTKIRGALMGKAADPMRNKVSAVFPHTWYESMRNDMKLHSTDYVKGKESDKAVAFRVDGMDVIFMDDRSTMEGFDPAAGVGYVYTKKSVVLGYGINVTFDVDWDIKVKGWLISGLVTLGAVVRLPRGVVKVLGPKQ